MDKTTSFSACDSSLLEDIYGDTKLMILSYYKGTAFPVTLGTTSKKWNKIKECYEDAIQQGLRSGISIPEHKTLYKKQVDAMEKFMLEWGNTHPSGMIRGDEIAPDLINYFRDWIPKGEDKPMSYFQNLWFMDVYCLIRLGEIKDDDMNGWVIMPSSCGEFMRC